MKSNNSRLTELDGLRGLAALSVFGSHVFGLIPHNESLLAPHNPLRLFWDGHAAVMLFFVLSGFVLSIRFVQKNQPLEPVGFIIKRIARLYPAYWCALAIAIALRHFTLLHNHLSLLSPWAASLWCVPLDLDGVIRHFFMISPGLNNSQIDPVIWSLVREMKISLIFPAIIFIVRRTPRWFYAATVLAIVVLLGFRLNFMESVPLFVAGSYLAKYTEVQAWSSRIPEKFKLALLPVALLFYGTGSICGQPSIATEYSAGVGSVILIVLFATSAPLKRFATSAPVHLLGEVSYSFYLVHLPILLAVSSALYPHVHSVVLCSIVALLISIAISKVLFQFIEVPTQQCGKWIVLRLPRRIEMPIG
jgi:peptidoglycan/LPS O-acetylase OafA/YrhL